MNREYDIMNYNMLLIKFINYRIVVYAIQIFNIFLFPLKC